MERVEELKNIIANQIERIANLEAIAQALADELKTYDYAALETSLSSPGKVWMGTIVRHVSKGG